MLRDECRHFDNALQGREVLKQTTVFNVSFHLRAIFQKKSFENSMILPAALSGIFLFLMHWCLWVLRTLRLVAISHVYRGWWASFSAQYCCCGWASFSAHFWTSGIYFYVCYVGTATIRTIGRRVEYVDNHQNYRSRSGICCRVQTSFSPC